ncbi:MAG: helix-turn-helix domain-containing protein [Dehalococcoidia bacterium]
MANSVKEIEENFTENNGMPSSGRGRPREDIFQRKAEIWLAVGPLIIERGASRLTMRDIAGAANLSVGALYRYFPNKRSLVLFALQPGVVSQYCALVMRREGMSEEWMEGLGPVRYLDAVLQVEQFMAEFLRPAVHVAMELGAGDLWRPVAEAYQGEVINIAALVEHLPGVHSREEALARTRRAMRMYLGMLLDGECSPEEFRPSIEAVLYQGAKPTAARSST